MIINEKILNEKQCFFYSEDLIGDHLTSVLRGDGIFSTFYFKEGKILYWCDHLERLQKAVGWGWPEVRFSKNKLKLFLTAVFKSDFFVNDKSNFSIALNLYSGIQAISFDDFLLTAIGTKLQKSNKEKVQLDVVIGDCRPRGVPGHVKFPSYLVANSHQRKYKNEILFLDMEENVLESCISNIFFVKDKNIYTSKTQDNILSGITRSKLIQICTENGLKVFERNIHKDEIESFDGAFLTSSISGIRIISRIGNKKFTSINDVLIDEIKSIYLKKSQGHFEEL